MPISGNYFQRLTSVTLYTVRLQLYKSCTMMFALIIYPRITMVDQYSDIRKHLQTFNVDFLGTSKMDIIMIVLVNEESNCGKLISFRVKYPEWCIIRKGV